MLIFKKTLLLVLCCFMFILPGCIEDGDDTNDSSSTLTQDESDADDCFWMDGGGMGLSRIWYCPTDATSE